MRAGERMAGRRSMGEVYARVNLVGPAGRKRLRLLVDTGSTYSWVREDRLRDLGIRPVDEYAFDTVQELEVARPIGEGVVEYGGGAPTKGVGFSRRGGGAGVRPPPLAGPAPPAAPPNPKLRPP